VAIRISTATTDDLPKIVASADALFETDGGVHNAAGINLHWASESGKAYYTSLLANGDYLVLLARDGNEVAGHLVGRLKGPDSVHPIRMADLESVHVYSAHRNRGIGEQLMNAFLAWAAEKGAQRAMVTAYAANDGARRFYARHGFAVRTVTLDLDLPHKPSDSNGSDQG
jgi:GNAT superfamily N-acetyltransferase